MTEAVLVLAAVINAIAAAGSAWFALKTVKTSERVLGEQQEVRVADRLEKRYEQQIEAPLREYLNVISTEWYETLQGGLDELDGHFARQASPVEIAAFVRRLTFSLRETWRKGSFNLLIGSEMWNRSLARELEKSRDELEERVSKVLNAQSASLPGRGVLRYSLANIIREHSLSVLDRTAKYRPRAEGDSTLLATAPKPGHQLGPGVARNKGTP